MIRKQCGSYPVSIFIAGSENDAARIAQEYCDEVGLCVTLSPTEYIYRGGYEQGVVIGLINYPRFPATPETIFEHAEVLGERLRAALNQDSFAIQAPDKTVWVSHRAPAPDGRA